MINQNFGAAASFQASASFSANIFSSPQPNRSALHHCTCGPSSHYGQPQAPQQNNQMMMMLFTMMQSMTQLGGGFQDFLGGGYNQPQQPAPYAGGGYGGGANYGGTQPPAVYSPIAKAPAPVQRPAPAPPAKKGGYA